MRLGHLGRARWAPRVGPRVRCWAEMACTQYSSGTVYLFFPETVYFIFDEFELILMSNSVQIFDTTIILHSEQNSTFMFLEK